MMPLDINLLERIKTNDFTLEKLDLSRKELKDKDIGELVIALSTNTTITILNVENNQIGAEGAKALAANTTLTTLNVRYNNTGAEGAKALAANATLTTLDLGYNNIGAEGAKALAANTTLTTLFVGQNQIGAEGAKALAANTTLTTLNVMDNNLEEVWSNQLIDTIQQNQQRMIKRRDQFIQELIIFARDSANHNSQSLFHHLPKDIVLHMINLIDFRSTESIGKSAKQIQACAAFIFNHTVEMNESLAEAVKTKQDFKLVEKIIGGKSQFQFFPANSLSDKAAAEIKTQEKKDDENYTKIKKIV